IRCEGKQAVLVFDQLSLPAGLRELDPAVELLDLELVPSAQTHPITDLLWHHQAPGPIDGHIHTIEDTIQMVDGFHASARSSRSRTPAASSRSASSAPSAGGSAASPSRVSRSHSLPSGRPTKASIRSPSPSSRA